jgi:predicted outer membrane repeat protein
MKTSQGLSLVAFAAVAAGVGLGLLASPEARAATITANGTTCTLNDAITTANKDKNTGGCVRVGAGTVDVIELMSDVTLTTKDPTPNDDEDDEGANGLPAILNHMTINGNGHFIQRDPALFSPANNGDGVDPCSGDGEKFRIFQIYYPGGSLTLNDATVSNGCAAVFGGGAIYHYGHDMYVNRVNFTNNKAVLGGAIFALQSTTYIADSRLTGNSAAAGGGVFAFSGTLSIRNSTLDQNSATGGPGTVCLKVLTQRPCFQKGSGGGIALNAGTTIVTDSTFTRNSAPSGGSFNNGAGTAYLTRVTLTQNSATNGGAVFSAGGSTRLVHATVVQNSATAGGAIFVSAKSRTVTVSNTLLENPAGGNCVFGATGAGVVSAGYNLSKDGSCGLTGAGDHQNVADLKLGSYADDGSPGNGHFPLLPGSPAIEAGTSDNNPTDQIGEVRIGVPDIGAIEYPRSVRIWIGVKSSTDNGLRVDLLAETFLNGAPSGQSQMNNLSAGKNGFANAILYTIPISVLDAPSGTQLDVRVSARRTCTGAGLPSGTVRLWYDGRPVDIAPADAGSRIGATAAGQTNYLFLRDSFVLDPVPGPGGASNLFLDELVNSASLCSGAGRPFTPFGTWSATIP